MFGFSIIYDLLYKDNFVASRLKEFFLSCCIENQVHLYDCYLFEMSEERFGLGALVLQEYDVEPYDLCSFNNIDNRNEKKKNTLEF